MTNLTKTIETIEALPDGYELLIRPDVSGSARNIDPTTADETKDDNTIRKCVKLAKSWGYGAMCVTNLFAWRATDPNAMKLANEPVGDYNDHYLMLIALNADMVIAAWSQHGNHQWRADYVRTLLERVPMKVLRMGKGKNG